MKALQLIKWKGVDGMEFRDIEAPKKESIKSTEVYIKVCAVSVNPIDWKTADGMLRPFSSLKLPSTVGFDVSGTIEAVGSDVKELAVGDGVMSRLDSWGSFQEYVISEAKYVAKKPESVSLVESAGIPLVSLTVLKGIEDLGDKVKDFQNAFVTAGLGGVGSYATQVLQNVYNVPVTTTVSTKKVDKMQKLVPGIKVIDYKKEDYTEKLSQVDFVFDTTGDLANEAKVVKNGAVVRSVGATPPSNVISEKFGTPYCPVRWALDLMSWKETRGFNGKNIDYEYFWLDCSAERLQRIAKYIDEGKVQVITDQIFEWSQAKEAFAKAKNGGVTGKVIIKVASD
ncbi:hypothetical protein TRICI_000590 [Trichomonascus ciferrii]|uniref:Enoyl reductase (ER) domain-containing protein n=1 Tax=Trichomonascus ciferrii TaxID=44093 RepID=A0A642VAW0_9ASCO|nr:hypothetical protein TRICI_000590 [Trichomonascus ciferrii]